VRGHKSIIVLGLATLNLFGLTVGIGVCLTASHVTDVLLGIAIVWLTGSAATFMLFAYAGRALSAPLSRLLFRAVLLAGALVATVGVLILAYGPDFAGLTVAIAFLAGSGMDCLAVIHMRRGES
jgi:hypothetical protein